MLTDAAIHRAIKAGKNTQLSDGKGRNTGRLVLIIRGRTAEWYAQQWKDGRKRLRKVGSYPAMSLASARQTFTDTYADTINRRLDIRISQTAKPGTLKDLFDGYVANLRERGKRSADDVADKLNTILRTVDGSLLASEVRPEHIIDALRPVYLRGSKTMADHMRSYVRSAYSWAMKSENDYRAEIPKRFFIKTNPAACIPTEPKVAGKRWLSEAELRAFWAWLHIREPYNPRAAIPVAKSNQDALKLICLTGQRVEMISELRAGQFTGDCLEWGTTKNGTPHLLPLPPQAVAILNGLQPNKHGWYFPAIETPEVPVTSGVLLSICRRFSQRAEVPHFTTRDLRRTWKTLAGKARISKEDRDLLQHHSRTDVSAKHYDRYEYLPEKRAAMARWGEWFEEVIEHPR